MNRDDIERMWFQAMRESVEAGEPYIRHRFAALVAAAEREACARVVENYTGAWDDQGHALTQAIRARGEA